MVGLFGTCAKSTWRESFIERFEKEGVEYFNPQLPDGTWTPEFAAVEAEHLSTDEVVVFPVLAESYGFASLAEIGFAAAQIMNSPTHRFLIVYVEDKVTSELEAENARIFKENRNARALVNSHLQKIENPRIAVVSSLEELLQKSLEFDELAKIVNGHNLLKPATCKKLTEIYLC